MVDHFRDLPNQSKQGVRRHFWSTLQPIFGPASSVSRLSMQQFDELNKVTALANGATWIDLVPVEWVEIYGALYDESQHVHTDPSVVAKISKDINRTFGLFDNNSSSKNLGLQYRVVNNKVDYHESLMRLLVAASQRERGYCQGMNFIAALFLLTQASEKDAFILLVYILKHRYLDILFNSKCSSLLEYMKIFDKKLRKQNKRVYNHLKECGFTNICYSLEWFTTCFVVSSPGNLASFVMDLLMVDVKDVLLRVGLAIMDSLQDLLLASSADEIHMNFKKLVMDIDPMDVLPRALVIRFDEDKPDIMHIMSRNIDKMTPGEEWVDTFHTPRHCVDADAEKVSKSRVNLAIEVTTRPTSDASTAGYYSRHLPVKKRRSGSRRSLTPPTTDKSGLRAPQLEIVWTPLEGKQTNLVHSFRPPKPSSSTFIQFMDSSSLTEWVEGLAAERLVSGRPSEGEKEKLHFSLDSASLRQARDKILSPNDDFVDELLAWLEQRRTVSKAHSSSKMAIFENMFNWNNGSGSPVQPPRVQLSEGSRMQPHSADYFMNHHRVVMDIYRQIVSHSSPAPEAQRAGGLPTRSRSVSFKKDTTSKKSSVRPPSARLRQRTPSVPASNSNKFAEALIPKSLWLFAVKLGENIVQSPSLVKGEVPLSLLDDEFGEGEGYGSDDELSFEYASFDEDPFAVSEKSSPRPVRGEVAASLYVGKKMSSSFVAAVESLQEDWFHICRTRKRRSDMIISLVRSGDERPSRPPSSRLTRVQSMQLIPEPMQSRSRHRRRLMMDGGRDGEESAAASPYPSPRGHEVVASSVLIAGFGSTVAGWMSSGDENSESGGENNASPTRGRLRVRRVTARVLKI